MLPGEKHRIIVEYVQRGIVSPGQIKKIQTAYQLSHRETETLVSDLLARGVCILGDRELEHVQAVQTSIFYQDRRRWNSLLNRIPLYRLMAVFFALPAPTREAHLSSFRSLPNWRQYLRELSRLELIAAGDGKDEVRLTEGFQEIQRTVHAYVDKGYVTDLQHSWRKIARVDAIDLAETVYQSPFFSSVVLPVIRDHCLSLPEVEKFVSWIAGCPTRPASMSDVVRHAIDCGELREIWWLLLGASASSSPAGIELGSDACFRCLRIGECTPRFAGRYDQGAIDGLLRQYRREIARSFLEKVADGNRSIEQLIPLLAGDTMLLRFVVDRNVVRRAKSLLSSLNILDNRHEALHGDWKSYCPFTDLWSLASGFAEQRP